MAVILQFPVGINCGLEFRIAHHKQRPLTDPIYFPNQRLVPVFVEPRPYIRANELGAAKLVEAAGGVSSFVVEVELLTSASDKLNRLARLPETTGLGVFKNDEPVSLIQAVHGADPKRLWWDGFSSLDEANKIIKLFTDS